MLQNIGIDLNTVLGWLAILLWSSTIALARHISEQIGPLTAGASVYLLASLFLISRLFGQERSFLKLRQLSRRYVVGCGGLFVLYTLSLFLALGLASNHEQTLEVALINYLWPALTLCFSLLLVGNQAGLGLIPGTLLAVSGVAFVLTQGTSISWSLFIANLSSNPAAYGLGGLAAVTWALYSNLARRWGEPANQSAVVLFTLAAGLMFGLLRWFCPEATVWSVRVSAEVILLAASTAAAYAFWERAMRAGNMTLVAASAYLTPFFSTAVSSLYLGIWPSRGVWWGCLLIMAGSLWSWSSVRQRSTGTALPGAGTVS